MKELLQVNSLEQDQEFVLLKCLLLVFLLLFCNIFMCIDCLLPPTYILEAFKAAKQMVSPCPL